LTQHTLYSLFATHAYINAFREKKNDSRCTVTVLIKIAEQTFQKLYDPPELISEDVQSDKMPSKIPAIATTRSLLPSILKQRTRAARNQQRAKPLCESGELCVLSEKPLFTRHIPERIATNSATP
jgi:hypothetical protein